MPKLMEKSYPCVTDVRTDPNYRKASLLKNASGHKRRGAECASKISMLRAHFILTGAHKSEAGGDVHSEVGCS